MQKIKTTHADWSSLIPVLPGDGPRTPALYAAIRQLIESGAVPAGGKLPPTRDLARRLGMSRAAVVAAFEMLIAEGFAQARTGAGTYVAAEVPRLRHQADEGVPPLDVPPPLPGTLGVAVSDARTLNTFRTLLSRHLLRPGPEHFRYGDPRGGLALREAVAAYLRTARGVRCHAGSVVITTGTQQGLDLVIRTALAPGDPVWIENPCYPMALAAFTGAGLQVHGVPVDGEGLDPARAPTTRAKAVYVTPAHQFPLGVTMSMRRRLALIEWARRNDAWIIEDDYDSEFRFAGPPLTALQGMDDSGHVIYLGTFSKVLFPGLRLGYAVVPEPLLARMVDLRHRSDRHPPTLAEAALTDLLREGHFAAHLRRARRRTLIARDELVAGLRSRPAAGVRVSVPDQGLHLIADLPEGTSDADARQAADVAGLGARRLSAMYLDGGQLDAPRRDGLVIGFSGFSGDDLRAAATRWVAAL